jgi:hypothetical protein
VLNVKNNVKEVGNEEELEAEADVSRARIGPSKENDVVKPPARYGHQLKLDVEVDRGAPIAGIFWRGRMVACSIIKEGIAIRKHQDSRRVIQKHPSRRALQHCRQVLQSSQP